MTRKAQETELAVWYDEHNFSPLTSLGVNVCLTRGMQQTLGTRFSKVYDVVYDKDHTLIVVPKAELDALVEKMVQRILDDPVWADAFNPRMMTASEMLLENTRQNAARAKTADNATLASFHADFVQRVDEMFQWGLPPLLAESNEGALSRAYYDAVKEKVGEGNFAAVADLLAPALPSAPALQRVDLLTLAMKQGQKKADLSEPLKKLPSKWSWVPYGFIGPAWTYDACRHEFNEVRQRPKEQLRNELDDLRNRQIRVEKKRDDLMKQYGFDAYLRQLTKTIAGFAQTKYKRKENFTHATFYYHGILAETAHRLQIPLRLARMLTPSESRAALVDGKVPELDARGRFAVYEYVEGNVQVLNEQKARAVEKQLPSQDASSLESLQGQCACPGQATGPAKIVNTEKDVAKLNEGDVLFSYATAPELMAAIRKASAIVTDRGGVTCHAAIVSRELNIPCVIGTKVGTQWIQEGQHVHVDATKGKVTKLA